MATVGISEFTFGYAFLYEQTYGQWNDLKAAPVLPSLIQEKDEGWDAKLPTHATDFYYQFKLSDYLFNGNAKYIADGTYTGPYYRVALHRRENNRQHQRLRALCANHPETFYVAPEFTTVDEFNTAFLARDLTTKSRIIKVSDCPDVNDGDQHDITFQPGDVGWEFRSERRRFEQSFFGKDLGHLYERTRKSWRRVDHQFAEHLFDLTAASVRTAVEKEQRRTSGPGIPLLDFNPRTASTRQTLRRTSEVLSVIFGVTMVLVGTNE